MLPGETHRKKSVGNLRPLYASFTFGLVQMGLFSNISEMKALILAFQSLGHSPKQLVENRHHPHSPAASRGLSPQRAWLCPYFGAGQCSSAGSAGALLSLVGCVPLTATRGGQAGLGERLPSGTRCRGFHSPGAALRALQGWDVGARELSTQGGCLRWRGSLGYREWCWV